jgi:hypothetical protein
MTTITHPDNHVLERLAAWTEGPFVTIHLPIDPTRRDLGRIELKSALQWAEESLVSEHGVARGAAAALLDPASLPAPDAGESYRGAVWFLAPGHAECITVNGPVGPAVSIGPALDTLGLLPFLPDRSGYHVLAFSQNLVRVFRCDRYDIEPVVVRDMPASLDDALWYIRREPTFERHGSGAMHASGGGAQFHKEDVKQYVHLIDEALAPVLVGSRAPLVVMAVEYEAAMFANETRYRSVVPTAVAGNPDLLDPGVIHDRTWDVVRRLPGAVQTALARAGELAGTGQLLTDFAEIGAAAEHGAVADLLVARSFAEVPHSNGVLAADRATLAQAVQAAARAGADVYAVDGGELPGGATAVAVLRY